MDNVNNSVNNFRIVSRVKIIMQGKIIKGDFEGQWKNSAVC